MAHRGVRLGIAYLNWTDTDMTRDADRYAALRELRAHMPPPARRVYPVDTVAARLVRGSECRRTAVYAPDWLRLTQPVRVVLVPVVLRVSLRAPARIEAAEPLGSTGTLGPGGLAERAVSERGTAHH